VRHYPDPSGTISSSTRDAGAGLPRGRARSLRPRSIVLVLEDRAGRVPPEPGRSWEPYGVPAGIPFYSKASPRLRRLQSAWAVRTAAGAERVFSAPLLGSRGAMAAAIATITTLAKRAASSRCGPWAGLPHAWSAGPLAGFGRHAFGPAHHPVHDLRRRRGIFRAVASSPANAPGVASSSTVPQLVHDDRHQGGGISTRR